MTSQPFHHQGMPPSEPARRREFLVVVLIAIALWLANVLAAHGYATVAMDEIMFMDPAVNLLQGHGWTSTAWFAQNRTELWSGNVPGYSWLLCGWLKVWGLGLAQARAFNFTLLAAAIILGWLAFERHGWLVQSGARICFFLVASLSFPLAFIYRSGRPDFLGILLCVLLLLAWTIQRRGLCHVALALVGAMCPWAGLQLLPFLLAIGVVVLVARRRAAFMRLVAVGGGVAMGGALLLLFYYHAGTLQALLASIHVIQQTAGATSLPMRVAFKLKAIAVAFLASPAFLPMLLAAVVLGRSLTQDRQMDAWKRLRQGVLVALLVGSLVAFVGHFPVYYHWMSFLILMAVLCSVASQQWTSLSTWVRCSLLALALAVVLSGLPGRLLIGAALGYGAEARTMEGRLRAELRPADTVFCNYCFYYPTRLIVSEVFLPHYLKPISAKERAAINVVILAPGQFESFRQHLPPNQQWRLVAAIPHQEGWLERLILAVKPTWSRGSMAAGYAAEVFRRVDN